MSQRLGIVMDPIESIKPYKDSSFAMLLAAQARGWPLYYMQQGDLSVLDGRPMASWRSLRVRDQTRDWFELGAAETGDLRDLDIILMRKDPPFNLDYIYSTYVLELAEAAGVTVVNRPASLRDYNEKAAIAWFPQCSPPTLISSSGDRIRSFIDEQGDAILKPLDGMGGRSIFRLRQDDPNRNVVVETLTDEGRHLIMVQRYLPEIIEGDKRILLIDGEPVPFALARIPMAGETRGNLAAGGRGVSRPLTDRDRWICAQLAPELRRRGLIFVGLDVIGDYLTEINITSPTCIRELDAANNLDIGGQLMDRLQALRRG